LIYKLIYTQRAIRDINKLETNFKERIGKTLLRYQANPFKHAEPLSDSNLGSYRFRVGNYRIIFDVEGDKIIILRVGHRKEIYKKR
jgi:mRNA interferase RelE/StbE